MKLPGCCLCVRERMKNSPNDDFNLSTFSELPADEETNYLFGWRHEKVALPSQYFIFFFHLTPLSFFSFDK
jgi:hypothetical protein